MNAKSQKRSLTLYAFAAIICFSESGFVDLIEFLFDSDAFGEVSGFVHVVAAEDGGVVG